MKFSTLVKLAFAAFIAGANAVSDEEAREQCVEASEKYSGCYFKSYTFTDDNLFDEMNQMCIDYYEEKCQSFYNKMEENGNILEGCEAYHENNLVANEKYDIFFYTNFVKHDPRYMHALMNLICEFNQYNDFCPIARNIASGRGHLGDDVIYENCKDYRCHVTYVKLLNWELRFAKVSDEVRHAVEVVNGDKCQDLFFDNNPDQERPTESSEKETTTTSKKSEPTSSTNGRCGPDYGACSGSNECCSKYGWCGTADDHCGSGCQSEFGVCGQKEATSTTDTTTSKTTTTKIYTTKATTSTKKSAPTSSSTKDRCGPDFGACSGSNECCSQYGWCGTSEVHCGSGCQSEFGICGQNAAPSKSATKTTTTKTTTKTTSKVPTSTVDSRCGPDFGACANSKECCSKHNYCGTSGDYCGTGCQPKYGNCW